MQVRSEVQECAIIVALFMFGIIVERFIEVLKETLNGGSSKSSAPVVILSAGDHKSADKYEIKISNWLFPVQLLQSRLFFSHQHHSGVSQ